MNDRVCSECKREIPAKQFGSHLKHIHKMTSNEYFDKYLKKEDNICLNCGKKTKFKSLKDGYRTLCSQRCVTLYYMDETRKKFQETIWKDANLIEVLNNEEIFTDLFNNTFKRDTKSFGDYYGVDRGIIAKRANRFKLHVKKLDKNICDYFDNKELLESEYKKYGCEWISREYKVSLKHVYNEIHRNNIKLQYKWDSPSSLSEREVREFVESIYKEEVIYGDRSIISPQELDIYIPGKQLAIEFNGLYWHSYIVNKDKNYHLNKTTLCEDKDIQLLHIFENEWLNDNKRDIWKSIIKFKLCGAGNKIYARNCIVRKVEKEEENSFFNHNHLQGKCNSSFCYGLEYNGKIVSLMSFGNPRYNKNIDFEMMRYASSREYHIVGGASRLLKYFIKDNCFPGNKIITYADKRLSKGNLYNSLGFYNTHDSSPNYFYFKDRYNIESRIKFQKHKLHKMINNYDSSKTEWDNMMINGYNKIYDSGNKVFVREV